jgi:hypothetical protein
MMPRIDPRLTRNEVLAAWSVSGARGVRCRWIAYLLGCRFTRSPTGTIVESVEQIARNFQVCKSTAIDARNLLVGAGIIRKADRRYEVA